MHPVISQTHPTSRTAPLPSDATRRWPLRAWLGALALLGTALLATDAAADARAQTDNVVARLVVASTHATPGENLEVGLHLRIRDGWHTYWSNPGDSGEATRIEWTLPAGVTAGAMRWPAPEAVEVGPLTNFGYHGDVLHVVPLSLPADWPDDRPLRLAAHATWLVCEDICIPEEAHLDVTVPIGSAAPGVDTPLFEAAARRMPVASPWPARFRRSDADVELLLDLDNDAARISDARFFPLTWGHVAPSAPQSWRLTDGVLAMTLVAGDLAPTDTLPGVLVITEDAAGEPLSRALQVEATQAAGPAGDGAPGLLAALALALLGGVLLNLMPCVLPVLSLKAFEVMSLEAEQNAAARRMGLAYTAGVLVFFALLGVLLLVLRSGGAALGWGFQLQWPPFVAAMIYLMFVLGLLMLGVVEFGGAWLGAGDGLTRRHGWQGSFFTGALAALVATPCTAPFMGAALGVALTLPAAGALAIMLALGFGLALPFLLLGFVPRLARALPRPGRWMARLRGALAFPLFATAVWLLWVLAQQVDANALAAVLAGLVALALGLWLWREAAAAGRRAALALRVVALGALAAAFVGLPAADRTDASAPVASASDASEAYTPARLAQLREAGTPVLVNLTAAWCITCQVNERAVLSRPAVRQALVQHQVAYLKGDWTNRDADITALLTRYRRAGVPLYLVFPAAGGAPRILPQILTETLVIDALADAARGASVALNPTVQENLP